jgi:hypothetical protein
LGRGCSCPTLLGSIGFVLAEEKIYKGADMEKSSPFNSILKLIKRFWYTRQIAHDMQEMKLRHLQRNNEENELKLRLDNKLYLERYGYKVYSQNDEDGIIEEIFNRIGVTNKVFIEFGVQNGLESNGHFLLHKGWRGLWLEGNKKDCKELLCHFDKPITNGRLVVCNAFITAENINQLIENEGKIKGEVDLLSIDIDGNDYHVWKAIECISPRCVVVEYNAKFPQTYEWVIEYNPNHVWDRSDRYGASLKSLELLGSSLGYQLVGTNMTGVNAFFVKKELAYDLFPLPPISENLYNPARRYLRYISGHQQGNTYIG